ncbi:MAG: hypothetical protein ACQEP5_06995 [Actinomycetota bacterium]
MDIKKGVLRNITADFREGLPGVLTGTLELTAAMLCPSSAISG